jgi:hypothetical protein
MVPAVTTPVFSSNFPLYSFTAGCSSNVTVTFDNVVTAGTYSNVQIEEARQVIRDMRDELDVENELRGQYRQPTPEEEERRRLRQEERQRDYEEYERGRQAAHDRAETLLISLLNETQRRTYEEHEWFEVVGSAGNLYRIHRGNSGNIHWLQDGEVAGRLCAHPSFNHGYLPDPDVALAQMLALRTDEPGFIEMANVHRGNRPFFGEENDVLQTNNPHYAA